jgi:hypothetical protein
LSFAISHRPVWSDDEWQYANKAFCDGKFVPIPKFHAYNCCVSASMTTRCQTVNNAYAYSYNGDNIVQGREDSNDEIRQPVADFGAAARKAKCVRRNDHPVFSRVCSIRDGERVDLL